MTKKLTPALRAVKALTFDVFGTVVDWRGSIAREGLKLGKELACAPTGPRSPMLARRLPAGDAGSALGPATLTNIDSLHRRILDRILDESASHAGRGAEGPLEPRLAPPRPWPDALRGLKRLKKGYLVTTLSNGNVSLLTNMAKHAGLPWDCVLSAELFHHYKPDPEAYLGAAAMLGLKPHEVMMVAAHKSDLRAAQAAGLRAAFVQRPLEFGDPAKKDLKPEKTFDVNAKDFIDLASKLGL